MAWTIDYTDTAKGQLRKLDKQSARRILDFMDERGAGRDDPRPDRAAADHGPHGRAVGRDIGKEADHQGTDQPGDDG